MLERNQMGKGFYSEYTEEIEIDRKLENRDVDLYQKTHDVDILERVFKNRIPTLKFWAKKHYFPGLAPSIEDFYGELVIVFVKAIEGYSIERGAFNTCLYTFLLNRIKNIKSGKYTKKRRPDSYDGPISGIMLSLNMNYDEKGGKTITLEEKIENEDSQDYKKNMDSIYFDESLKILSNGDETLTDMLKKIGNGQSINSVLKEYKTKNGEIHVDQETAIMIKDKRRRSILSKKIEEMHKINNFKLMDYCIEGTRVKYVIEFSKTKESLMLSKTLRHIRKNKNTYSNLLRVRNEVE